MAELVRESLEGDEDYIGVEVDEIVEEWPIFLQGLVIHLIDHDLGVAHNRGDDDIKTEKFAVIRSPTSESGSIRIDYSKKMSFIDGREVIRSDYHVGDVTAEFLEERGIAFDYGGRGSPINIPR